MEKQISRNIPTGLPGCTCLNVSYVLFGLDEELNSHNNCEKIDDAAALQVLSAHAGFPRTVEKGDVFMTHPKPRATDTVHLLPVAHELRPTGPEPIPRTAHS